MFTMTIQARCLFLALILLSTFVSFVYFSTKSTFVIALPSQSEMYKHEESGSRPSLKQILQFVHNSDKFSITTPAFENNGDRFELPPTLGYTAPLGKDVCILDVDTRSFDEGDQIFHDADFDWAKLEPHSGGVMNHYMYAQTHGYDYKFYRSNVRDDRHPTWVKIAGLAKTLLDYKYVIFLDSDALFNHMQVPIEWLLNYWEINSTTSLAMALDPPSDTNEDAHGRRYTNTGFIIAQNNPKTFEILQAWDECPSENRYQGCSHWNRVGFHEQSAYGEYIRYDYDNYLKELPCNEGNGEWDLEACRGVFIQHMWWRTSTARSHFGDRTLQSLMGQIHAEIIDRKREIIAT